MGFFGVWAPGVLPFPVVIPLKDRVIDDPGARRESMQQTDLRWQLEAEIEEELWEREDAARDAALWRARAEVAEKRHELEARRSSDFEASSRVLADPTASHAARAEAIGTVAVWEVIDSKRERDTALANDDRAVASAAEQRIIAAHAAVEHAYGADDAGPAPSHPGTLDLLRENLGPRFDEAMRAWRKREQAEPLRRP